ncbi:hypothetical protein MTO96_034149 [Rhipicephalus appendiculatus]
MVRVMMSNRIYSATGVYDMETFYSLAVFMENKASSELEYIPACICIWRGLPFVAFHTAEMNVGGFICLPQVDSTISDLGKRLYGIYGDLDSAHAAATRRRAF